MSDFKTVIGSLDNVCLSGGAEGADLQWGMMAGRNGFSVIHWSFGRHKCEAPVEEVVRLTQEQLVEADEFVKRANIHIKRRFPTSNEYTNNLLRRNWYQVSATGALYAVGTKNIDGSVDGGTSWAVQMYMDRFIYDGEASERCKLFFFDQNNHCWWSWKPETGWSCIIGLPPKPTGVWTGIGSRNLTSEGKWAIRRLMGGYICGPDQIAAIYPTVEEPKVGDHIYLMDNMGECRWAGRKGGVATVTSIQHTSDDLYLSVQEWGNLYDISWNSIREMQIDLRAKYGMTVASLTTRN